MDALAAYGHMDALAGYGAVRHDTGQLVAGLGDPYATAFIQQQQQLQGLGVTEEITTLWIGNAVPGTTDADLAHVFAPFGELMCCFLLKRLSNNGQLSGFVRYYSREHAAEALNAVTAGRIVVKGSPLAARWTEKNSMPKPKTDSDLNPPPPPATHTYAGEEITTIWVGNVLPGTLDTDMAGVFSQFGALVCCFLLKRLSPNGQLSGFVRYTTRAEANAALETALTGTIALKGSIITAKWAAENSKPLDNQQLAAKAEQIAPAIYESSGEEIATLWVGNVLQGTTDADMVVAFSPYGPLLCCFLLKKLSPNGQLSGFVRYTSRGEASFAMEAVNAGLVVVLGSTIHAKWAQQNSQPLNHPIAAQPANLAALLPAVATFPQGQSLLPMQSQFVAPPLINPSVFASASVLPPQAQAGEELMTLAISNVVQGTTDADMRGVFAQFGRLVSCFLFRTPVRSSGTLSGFVQFASGQEAHAALSVLGGGTHAFNGAVLQVKWGRENSRPP